MAHSWDITRTSCGRYGTYIGTRTHKNKCHFILIFIIFHAFGGIYTPNGCAQKLTFFCTFFEKNAQNRGNSAFFTNFMGHIWHITRPKNVQKIAKNCSFFDKIAQIRLFWAILPKIMGHIRDITQVPHELTPPEMSSFHLKILCTKIALFLQFFRKKCWK